MTTTFDERSAVPPSATLGDRLDVPIDSQVDAVDLAEFARRGVWAHREQVLFEDSHGPLRGRELLAALQTVDANTASRAPRVALTALLRRWAALRGGGSTDREARHRAGAYQAAVGSILHGTGDGRWLVKGTFETPHEQAMTNAVLGGAWATGSPVFVAEADLPAAAWRERIQQHRPTTLITGIADVALWRDWVDAALAAGVQRWTLLLPPSGAARVDQLALTLQSWPDGIHLQWVIADPLIGFLAVRDHQASVWRAAPTVGVRVCGGRLQVQSPQIALHEPQGGTVGGAILDGWLDTRLKAYAEDCGFTLQGNEVQGHHPRNGQDERLNAFSLALLFDRAAQQAPEQPAIRFGEHRMAYGVLRQRVHRLAAALSELLHVRSGDRVALLSRNRPEFVELYWALNHLGAIFVPINFRLKASEVAYILNDSGARLLFTEPGNDALLAELAEQVPELHAMQLPGVPAYGLDSAFESLIEAGKGLPTPAVALLGEDAPASILYTAGTTGFPKGAVRSNKNVFWFAMTGPIVASRLKPGGSHLLSTPMFHVAGHEAPMIGALITATQQVILHEVRVDDLLAVIEEEDIGLAFVPPTIGLDIARRLREGSRALDRLRYWNSASAPLPTVLRDEILQRLPQVVFRNSLGMTEAGVLLRQEFTSSLRKPANSVGRPVATVDVQLVDGKGQPVLDGDIGEIVVRTPQSVTRYWRNDQASLRAVQGGWFRTGDLGRIDEEGDVQIMGRAKEMIITGGENVYSTEVENALFAHPGVREVAVFGVAHPRWGEAVVAAVVPESSGDIDEAALIAHCRGRIAHYKSPLRVFVQDSLPKNSMGKVLKFQLQETYGNLPWA